MRRSSRAVEWTMSTASPMPMAATEPMMLKTSTTDMPTRITRVAARPSVPADAGRRHSHRSVVGR